MTINNTVSGHRNTEGLSDLGKQIIASCPKAYVNEYGQVIDPCHAWWGGDNDIMRWDV